MPGSFLTQIWIKAFKGFWWPGLGRDYTGAKSVLPFGETPFRARSFPNNFPGPGRIFGETLIGARGFPFSGGLTRVTISRGAWWVRHCLGFETPRKVRAPCFKQKPDQKGLIRFGPGISKAKGYRNWFPLGSTGSVPRVSRKKPGVWAFPQGDFVPVRPGFFFFPPTFGIKAFHKVFW